MLFFHLAITLIVSSLNDLIILTNALTSPSSRELVVKYKNELSRGQIVTLYDSSYEVEAVVEVLGIDNQIIYSQQGFIASPSTASKSIDALGLMKFTQESSDDESENYKYEFDRSYITLLNDVKLQWNATCIRNGTYCIDRNIIFRGGHGEIYRAHRVTQEKLRNTFTVDNNSSFILKRMSVANRPAILRCALREVYFGYKLKPLAGHRVARYVSYFNNEDDYWLVFRDEGFSLQSLLYVIIMDEEAGVSYHSSSKLWYEMRQTLAGNTDDADFASDSRSGEDLLKVIMLQLIKCVADLHKFKIIHRDLKPSNIVINSDQEPQLLLVDFSSAVSTDCIDAGLYGEHGPLIDEATLDYAPPEVLLSVGTEHEIPYDKDYPYAYDSWSIGVIFLELILGTTNVFSVNEREAAKIKQNKNKNEIHNKLLLSAYHDFCILSNDSINDTSTSTKSGSNNDINIDAKAHAKDGRHWKASSANKCSIADAIYNRDPLRLGYPNQWALDLLTRLLAFKPERRMLPKEALQHAYFTGSYISKADFTEHATLLDCIAHDINLEAGGIEDSSQNVAVVSSLIAAGTTSPTHAATTVMTISDTAGTGAGTDTAGTGIGTDTGTGTGTGTFNGKSSELQVFDTASMSMTIADEYMRSSGQYFVKLLEVENKAKAEYLRYACTEVIGVDSQIFYLCPSSFIYL